MTPDQPAPPDDRQASATIAALVAALGLGDGDTVAALHADGVRAELVPVLEWLPAVDICWLDGTNAAERHALRVQFASDARSTPEGVALLDRWLTERPAPEVFAAGKRALAVRLRLLPADERDATLERIVALCQAAGRAAGAAFGVGALSSYEQARIVELREELARLT